MTYALDAQLDLYQWLNSNPEKAYHILSFIKPDAFATGDEHMEQTKQLLGRAETYHVEDQWGGFLDVATEELVEMEPHPVLSKTDLMSMTGFAYFERPVMVRMIPGDGLAAGTEYASIKAMLWGVSPNVMRPLKDSETGEWSDEMVPGYGAIAWVFIERRFHERLHGGHTGEDFTLFDGLNLIPFDVQGWAFDTEWVEVDYYSDRPPGTVDPSAASWRRNMYAFWHLLSSYVYPLKTPRGARRRWEREFPNFHKPDYGTIKHVTLRRAQQTPGSKEGSGMGTRDYSHRFMVRGHWRNQYYPSLDAHKPIWIDPHVRGPEDKPLILKDRVFDVRR